MKTITPILLLVVISFSLSAQKKQDTILAYQYYQKADSLLTKRTTDSSIVYFKKALPIYKKAKAWERVADCQNGLSSNYIFLIENDKALASLENTLSLCDTYQLNNQKAKALDHFGNYYYHIKSNRKKAEDLFKKALEIRKKLKQPFSLFYSYLNIAKINIYKREYEKAETNIKKAWDLQIEHYGTDHFRTADIHDLKGYYYLQKWEFEQVRYHFEKSLEIRLAHFGEKNLHTRSSLGNLGVYYYVRGDNDMALQYVKKVLAIERSFFGEDHLRLRTANLNLANVYKEKGSYDLALEMLEKTAKTIRKEFGRDHIELFPLYYNIASIHYKTGRWNKALDYNQKLLELIKKTDQLKSDFANVYNKIGLIYTEMNDFDNAEMFLKKSMDLKEEIYGKNHIAIADTYNNLGIIYRLQKLHKKALTHFEKSLAIKQKKYGDNHRSIANSLKEIGNLFIEEGKFEKAKIYLTEALQIRKKLYGKYNPSTKVIQNLLGDCYNQNKKYSKALEYYESALLVDPENKDKNINFGVQLTSLKGKAQSYTSLFKQTNQEKYLDSSETIYQTAEHTINVFRHNLRHYKDKLILAKESKQIYRGAMQNQLLLYHKTKDKNFLKRAFIYNEQGKSNTLKEQLLYSDAVNFSGIPNDLIQLEKSLNVDRSYYRSKINKGKNDSIISAHKNLLFALNRTQDSLTTLLETNYPNYYQLKYQNDVIAVSNIQKQLDKNTTLLEFFTADSITYAFTISKNKFDVKQLQTPNLEKQIQQLLASITKKNNQYKGIAHQLYQTLINPIKEELVGNQLIIIPDGPLWHLNFDLLLTQPSSSNNPKNWPYLVKEYAISYANSATLLFTKNKDVKQENKEFKECLAFSFSSNQNYADAKTMSLKTLRNATVDLPGTRQEIKTIANLMDGQYFYGDEASEANFKKQADQYTILHLALHGTVDNERPENSKLYFTKSKDTIEDGLLYSHELFALNIPAELTVLSACNTGSGKIAKGEGIMSLGNAFQYAGTKSLLLTNWEVSDQTTPEIMKYFYTHLKKGSNKAKALQQAKLKYLASANEVSNLPFYWGGFYLLGDTAPVQLSSTNYLYWILGVTMLGVLLFGAFWFYKKKI